MRLEDGTTREVISEFLGTSVLMTVGLGVVAQAVLGEGSLGGPLSINLGWGIGVVLGCVIAGSVSGAHLNPAVTLALACWRGFPWRKVPGYVAAQLVGAIVAAAVVHLTYREALDTFDGGVRQVLGEHATAGIFFTSPQPFLSWQGGLVDQIVATGLLVCVAFALGDRRGPPLANGIAPLIMGLTVVGIGVAFGFNCGYAINPARDFGPRLWTALAGWGGEVFVVGHRWWWVPIVGPALGGIAGGWLYDACIRR